MPKSKSKKFIDKKDAVTFRLVHRSQQDPLVADETAPQRVLQPIDDKTKVDKQKRIEEQHKFGIYYDDDYDYLQHLREAGKDDIQWEEVIHIPASKPQKSTEPKIMLPSSVFASKVEEDVGMLNKAAPVRGPQLNLDPDIVAAMDDDFNYDDPENELEDDFITLANAPCSDIEEEGEDDSDVDFSSDADFAVSDEEDDENKDNVENNKRPVRFTNTAKSEGKKSFMTNYTYTSYTEDRHENLKLLDARFEKFMEKHYTPDQIGELEEDEPTEFMKTDYEKDIMEMLLADFEQQKVPQKLPEQDPELKKTILRRAREMRKKPEEYEYIQIKPKIDYDIVSVHSKASNIYNRPKLIELPSKKKNKNKQQSESTETSTEKKGSVSSEDTSEFDDKSIISDVSRLSVRPKNETPEEKRVRKQEFKEYKKQKRENKKALKGVFTVTKINDTKVKINNDLNKGARLV